ncbi:MAG TPA: hypothetical protein VN419_07560 [Humidesulfovibrio sp.]|uniref:hypothetical protein n=1 Tax=Humidesulfovibrio sp. TaxID=2910988 RepID=UPI002C344994|nr:hypothetical protein [Humidesulfovibrio sp.]HWR03862.1 hypothetical protein [Humidesulfovibrio sp.]
MQRMLFLAVLAALTVLGGCAGRDPNLAVKGMNQFSRTPGDYTLRVNLYDLDAQGRPQLASRDDASLRGFVTRTLSARGYSLKASGPARYDVSVHLLCGNMRTADMGLMAEELRVPAADVGPGYSEEAFYWLPDMEPAKSGASAQVRHDSAQMTRVASGSSKPTQGAPGGTTRPVEDLCQGRVLVVLAPSAPIVPGGPARELFVGRAATEDCRATDGCKANVCRNALEQSLVDLLERRF